MPIPTVPKETGDALMGVRDGEITMIDADSIGGSGGTGTGDDGASAYEIAVINGFVGTEQEWLDSLEGSSAYQIAVDQGFVGTVGEWVTSLTGPVGDSAYQVAVNEGFVGDVVAWIASLQGSDGKSAYQSAVDDGFVGTESEWVLSLKGEDGADSVVPGPTGKSAYQSAVDGGFVGTEQEWVDSIEGVPGDPGDDAYEVAVAEGFVGSREAWLTSLVGLNGANGKSAYQIALDEGFVGTEAEFIESLRGEAGQDGADGSLGEITTVAGVDITPTPGSYTMTGTTPPTEDAYGILFDNASFSTAWENLATQNNTIYRVTFTVSEYVGGETSIRLYGSGQFNEGPRVSGNGTYVHDIDLHTAGGSLNNAVAIVGVAGGTGLPEVTFRVKIDSIIEAGTGSQPRPAVDKVREIGISFLDYYEPTDGNDYAPAITRALAVSKNLLLPDGVFNITNPFPAVDGMHLHGKDKRGNGCKFIANNGLFYNTSATVRKSYVAENFRVDGNRTAIAIRGPFGGRLENVEFRGFTKHVENAFGFLFDYIRCRFYDSEISVHTAVTNAVNVIGCFWAADCEVCFDSVTLPASDTSGGGYTGSLPMKFIDCNVNRNGISDPYDVALRFSGLVKFDNNYLEDYGAGVPNTGVFAEFLCNRFAGSGLQITNNEINGQGAARYALRFYGSHSLACAANGVVTRNRVFGMSGTDEIVFGTDADPTLNNIPNLRVFDNFGTISKPHLTMNNQNPLSVYRPAVQTGFTTPVSVAGATLVTLPMGAVVSKDNCDGVINSTTVRARKDGVYDVFAEVQFRTTAADYRNLRMELFHDGVSIGSAIGSLIHSASGDSYTQLTIHRTVDGLIGDDFTVRAANGQDAYRGSLSVRWRDGDNF